MGNKMENGLPPRQATSAGETTPLKHPTRYMFTLYNLSKAPNTEAACTFTSEIKWNDHVNNVCNKSNKTIGFLKRNRNIDLLL